MGFFDNILKKVGATLAARYGTVITGEYANCSIAMGNPPKKKVTTANSFSQLILIKDNEEVVRFDIAKDIESIKYEEIMQFGTGALGYRCEITFANKKVCLVDLFSSKIRIFYDNVKNVMTEETIDFFLKEFEKRP